MRRRIWLLIGFVVAVAAVSFTAQSGETKAEAPGAAASVRDERSGPGGAG